jgi:hypothetical protein
MSGQRQKQALYCLGLLYKFTRDADASSLSSSYSLDCWAAGHTKNMVRRVVASDNIPEKKGRKERIQRTRGWKRKRSSIYIVQFGCAERYGAPLPPAGFLYTQTVDIDFLIESHTATVGPPRLPSATSAAIRNSRSSEDEFGIDGNEREGERGYPVRNWTKVRDYIVVTIEHLSYCPKWSCSETEKTRTPQYIAWTIEGPRGRQTGELEKWSKLGEIESKKEKRATKRQMRREYIDRSFVPLAKFLNLVEWLIEKEPSQKREPLIVFSLGAGVAGAAAAISVSNFNLSLFDPPRHRTDNVIARFRICAQTHKKREDN